MIEQKRSMYVSVGDRHWKVGLPFDSRATIEAIFDAMAERFHVNRVFWRVSGEIWLRYYRRFDDDCLLYSQGYNRDSRTLCDEVGVTPIAREAARRHGMELWAHTGLYCLGSRESIGMVDPILLEYPEAAPVNRYGTRRQEGAIELCHTEARRALVKRYTEFVVENGFAGLDFYLYLENLSLRYMDEFGYSQLIVEEYKRRYGVDILHEGFDKDAWGKIRGEYLTRFLRELREALGRHGRKLSVELDPKHPDLPHTHGNDANPHHTTGRIHVDWRTWAREGIVDELVVLRKGSTVAQTAALQRQLLETIGGTGCRISLSEPGDHVALECGVTRMLSAWGPELESGFSYADHVGWGGKKFPDEFIADAPEVMVGGDRYARRRFLYYVANGAAQASVDEIAAALGDEDVFVRRRAVDALGASGSPDAVPPIEASLSDPELSVRCRAAIVLGQLNGPKSEKRLLEAVARPGASAHFIEHCVAPSLAAMAVEDADSLADPLLNPNLSVRRTVLFTLKHMGDGVLLPLVSRLSVLIGKDPDPYNRMLALSAASRMGGGR
ncbi:MAG: HEAT repeat domain-containing protein [Candidatus Latescibacterota bacterium]